MENNKPINHAEILDLWPSIPTIARDLNFNYVAVWKWHKRKFIPCEWWALLIEVAHERDIEISFKLLADTVKNKKLRTIEKSAA